MTKPDLTTLTTEAQNPHSRDLDAMPTLELLAVMNAEDRQVAEAVRHELPRIAAAVSSARPQ